MVRLPDAAGQLGSAEDVKNVRELRDIPIRVLRGLFSGVGQLLLAADRLRTEEAQRETITSADQAGPPAGPDGGTADARAAGEPDGGVKAQAASQRTFRSLDSTGNVRVLTPDMPAESSPADDQPPAASAGLPVAGYDGLSPASLRARLRNLDAEQVRALLDYERSAANRADVATMFERRIAKLEKLETSPDAP
jgi:hypothetical protein